MTESEWHNETLALMLLMGAGGFARDDEDNPTGHEWRTVAARVACLDRLGGAMPGEVRTWVDRATAYLDREERSASAESLLDDGRESIYAAFREAFSTADREFRQRLAAAQDVFRGYDYYAENEAMLDQDETSETYTGPVYVAESAVHCRIIRDIFGNPFRPPAFDPAWRTDTTFALARTAYETKDFAILPILADALEEAGCDDEAILTHCRGDGPHVRGCWVVDLALGRE